MKSKDCRECAELLGQYLDGELDEGRTRAVETHLASCQDCRQEFEALKTLHQMVKEKDTGPRLAEDYWDWHRHQVWRGIRSGRRRERQAPARQGFFWFRLGVVAAGVAVVMVVVLGGWKVLLTGHEKPEHGAFALKGEETHEIKGYARGMAAERGAGREDGRVKAPASGKARVEVGLGGASEKHEIVSDELSPLATARAGSAPPEPGTIMDFVPAPSTAEEEPKTPLTAASCDSPPVLLSIPELPFVSPEDTATVLLGALVEPDGSVSRVELQQSSGVALLDTIALVNVREASFTPGVKKGSNVRCWVLVPQHFKAEGR